jgi:hypothetical protein
VQGLLDGRFDQTQAGGSHQHKPAATLAHHLHRHVAGLFGGGQGVWIQAHGCWP